MSMGSTTFVGRRHEQGQTIILVAVALIALLSMAALAIDVVTLYVARSEAQRAANAAAIAGAKMFATSGFTSVQGAVLQTEVCQSGGPGLPAAANIQAAAVAAQNTVAGHVATIQRIQCAFPSSGNPQITVTINQGGLPTFFARIWSRALNSVSATAVAEAYNPSGLQPPIQVSVKPWFIPNCDPGNKIGVANPTCPGSSTAPFVYTAASPGDGSIANNGSFIGKTIQLTKVPFAAPLGMTLCKNGCTPCPADGCETQYYPLDIPATPAPVCPSPSAGSSCTNVGTGNDYFDNISCTSQRQISCGQILGRGEAIDIVNNNNDSANTPATEATQCLTHASNVGLGQGQDIFSEPGGLGKPFEITGGDNNPNPALRGVANISRSDSVVTVPLYDTVGGATPLNLCRPNRFCNRQAAVVGFLQLAIKQALPANGVFQATIVNASGCSPTPAGNAVSGGGVSPIPVRLITPP
jgi:hypothetical protein